jgi:hypothetical protein
VSQSFQQEAGRWFTWNNGRSGIPSIEQSCAGVQSEATLQWAGCCGVTLEAVFGEHRADAGFEKIELLTRKFRGILCGG